MLPQGIKMAEVVRELGIHEVAYYRWRKEYGGMRGNQLVPLLFRVFSKSRTIALRRSC